MSNLFSHNYHEDNDYEYNFYKNKDEFMNYTPLNLNEQEDIDSFKEDKNLDNINITNHHNLPCPFLEDKTTAYKTNPNLNYTQNEKDEINEPYFPFFSYESILNILKNNLINSEVNEKFVKNKNMENMEDYMIFGHKKRKRSEEKECKDKNENPIDNIENKESNKNKRGRVKTNFEIFRKEHNKMDPDNIIKKIKAKLFEYSLEFMNKLLRDGVDDDNKAQLLKLDYKSINQLKRDNELSLIKTPLKDFFSSNISPKYKLKNKDFNKRLIERIINKQYYVNDYNTIKFVLDLTFGDWLELFTYKKNVRDLIKSDDDYNVDFKKIEDSLIGVNVLLNEKVKEFDLHYFSNFIFYIYNYERWFYIKKPRRKIQ